MKKQLSPGLMAAIGIGVAVIVIGGGLAWMGKATNPSAEDPELARKQWEVEKARTPGGGVVPTGNPGAGAPGRDAELAARQQHSGQ